MQIIEYSVHDKVVRWEGRLGRDHTEEQQPAGLRVPAALVIGWLAVKFS